MSGAEYKLKVPHYVSKR